ncbi:hypothetical protein B0H34DRAFT_707190 [Crassisporium funariophilum]|nr:hypothetical protein B0H34DRAFT_707190 [Crassisporium funariophilum]
MPFPERPSLLAVFDPKPPVVCLDAGRRSKEQKILPSVAQLMCGEDNWSLRLPPLCTSDQGLERRSKLLPHPPMQSVPWSTTASFIEPPQFGPPKSSTFTKQVPVSEADWYTQPLPSRGIKKRRSYTPTDDRAPGFVFVEYGPDSTTERDATVAPKPTADNYVFEVPENTFEVPGDAYEVPGDAFEVSGKTRRNEEKPKPEECRCQWMLVAGMCDFRGAKSTVTRHVNAVHLGLRLFPCTYGDCERSFAQRSTRTVHINTKHTGYKPHLCPHCEAKFSDPARRNKHVAGEHPEMPQKKRRKLNRGRSAYRNEPKSST